MNSRVYADHAATTPVRSETRAAMLPYLEHGFGNPSSLHADGQFARRALDAARVDVSEALGCQFSEVTFTSGGTEADNAALLGILLAHRNTKAHFITTQIEHEAVLNAARWAERLGFDATYLAPDEWGRISPEQVRDAIRPDTIFASVMHANNEVGTVQPVREMAEVCHAHSVMLHTDAVQSFGQLPTDIKDLGVDLLTVSAHKIGGPKGVGALYVRSGIAIEPFLHGGAQERERRAGTENVAGIAGFGTAARLAASERAAYADRVSSRRDLFWERVQEMLPFAVRNGCPDLCLPNNINISLPGLDAESLLVALDMEGVSASSGSACTSGSIEPSHVLSAMGLSEERVRSALRFTWGKITTEEDVLRAAEILARVARRMHP